MPRRGVDRASLPVSSLELLLLLLLALASASGCERERTKREGASAGSASPSTAQLARMSRIAPCRGEYRPARLNRLVAL